MSVYNNYYEIKKRQNSFFIRVRKETGKKHSKIKNEGR